MMTLKDMVGTIRVLCGTVEVRDENNYEIGTFPLKSEALEQYADRKVQLWFPGGAPFKTCSFTVILAEKDGEPDDT